MGRRRGNLFRLDQRSRAARAHRRPANPGARLQFVSRHCAIGERRRRMKNIPVLRESIAVFFSQGEGFQVYFYLLVILAPVQFLALYLPSLDVQAWSGSAGLFKITAVTTLVLIVYFAL